MSGNSHIAIRQVELIHISDGLRRVLKDTIKITRELLAYLCDVACQEWDSLAPCSSKERLTFMEHLVHRTEKNPCPKYGDFDEKFRKLPSYLRRAAINAGTGAVSSYMTRLADYEDRKHAAMSEGRRFREKPPVFNASASCLTLYKKNMYTRSGKNIRIKVFIRNTWDWVDVAIPGRDHRDLEKTDKLAKSLKNPSLVYKNHKFYLAFPVDYGSGGFPDVPLEEQKVLAVDLGINHGAVCSVIDFRGNVLFRAFDPFRRERASVDSAISAVRHVQRKSGVEQSLSAVYQKLNGRKNNYVKHLAHWIVELAAEHGVYGIVLENLGRMRARGSKKDRIHHWCKAAIRDFIKGMAFRHGIRVFIVNPKNTSRLAYDGSGEVSRDKNDFSLCTFASGKRYACDLSASYNIGARYFLRAMQKAMSPEAWGQLKAEVPELATRTRCTLSTLWKAGGVLRETGEAGTPDAA